MALSVLAKSFLSVTESCTDCEDFRLNKNMCRKILHYKNYLKGLDSNLSCQKGIWYKLHKYRLPLTVGEVQPYENSCLGWKEQINAEVSIFLDNYIF